MHISTASVKKCFNVQRGTCITVTISVCSTKRPPIVQSQRLPLPAEMPRKLNSLSLLAVMRTEWIASRWCALEKPKNRGASIKRRACCWGCTTGATINFGLAQPFSFKGFSTSTTKLENRKDKRSWCWLITAVQKAQQTRPQCFNASKSRFYFQAASPRCGDHDCNECAVLPAPDGAFNGFFEHISSRPMQNRHTDSNSMVTLPVKRYYQRDHAHRLDYNEHRAIIRLWRNCTALEYISRRYCRGIAVHWALCSDVIVYLSLSFWNVRAVWNVLRCIVEMNWYLELLILLLGKNKLKEMSLRRILFTIRERQVSNSLQLLT